MITEDYVSYEVAVLLKEKGFDEYCGQIYDNDKYLSHNLCGYINEEKSNEFFSALAPTHQMAMKWLREVHHIFIGIEPYDSYYEERYEFEISVRKKNSYEWDFKDIEEDTIFKNYEEAVEAALKYSLENLI